MLTFEQLLRNEEYQKGRDDGFDDGLEKGLEKGQRELLATQLTRRFGELPAAIAGRLARAGRDELMRWGQRILDAASLDDVFAPT